MSQYNQNQFTEAYPPPPPTPSTAPTYVAPPPAGYPAKDGIVNPQNNAPIETKTRGAAGVAWCECCGGFLGCCGGLLSCLASCNN